MTIHQPDGSPGLLAKGQFGDAVIAELGKLDLDKEVKKVVDAGDQVRFSTNTFPQYFLRRTKTELDLCALQRLQVCNGLSS